MSFMNVDSLMSLISSSAAIAVATAAIWITTRYLQRGDSPYRAELQKKVLELRDDIEKDLLARGVGQPFTEQDKEMLMQTMQEHIRGETIGTLFIALESRVAEKYGERQILQLVVEQGAQTLSRLRQELFSLSRRSNLNLAIGIVTTITGLLMLGMFVLRENPSIGDGPQFLAEFVPRISLVLLIEVFAYFFLRLYKSTLAEIKYFQNEITSIEAKFLALTVAASVGKEEQLKSVLEQLFKTERNFILDRGQSTIDLERSRLDQRIDESLMDKLSLLLQKTASNKGQ